MSYLHGIVCANITPFDKEGEVDYKSVRRLSVYLAESGLAAIFPMGTNGEGIALRADERKKIAETIVSEIAGSVPVVIQCGANTVESTVELVSHARKIGAQSAGVLTPYFFRQSQEALLAFYKAVSVAAGDFPLYIYNIPSHTNNDIQSPAVEALARECPNIVGIKYSYPDLMRLSEYLRAKPGFDVLIGCDGLILPAHSLGAAGTVSGPAAVFPRLFSSLWEACLSGDAARAKELQGTVKANDEALAKYQSIPLLKLFLKSRGVIAETRCRIPFKRMGQDEEREILGAIERML